MSNDSIAQFSGGNITDTSTDSTSYFVNIRQPLFNLPSYYDYRQSMESHHGATAQLSLEEQNLAIRVAEAYFNTLRAIDNLENIIVEEDALKTILVQAKQRFEVGLISAVDVHEAQAADDEVVAQLLNARGQLGVSFEAMSELTGQFHTDIVPLSSSFPIVEPTPSSVDEWVAMALKSSASLKASDHLKNAAELNYKARRSAHLPTLDLSADLTDNNTDGIRNLQSFTNEGDSNVIMLSLRVPLFAGGRIKNQRELAYQQLLGAQESHTASERSVLQTTRSLHLKVVTKVSQIEALRKSVNSSQSALDATQAAYDIGTRDLADVLVTKRTFHRAKRNLSNARYDYIIDLINLRRAAGVLSKDDLTLLNSWLDEAATISRSRYL